MFVNVIFLEVVTVKAVLPPPVTPVRMMLLRVTSASQFQTANESCIVDGVVIVEPKPVHPP
jgi:hypothetical protein